MLVLRNVIERMEGVHAGTAILVGTDKNKIISETTRLLTDLTYYENIAKAANP